MSQTPSFVKTCRPVSSLPLLPRTGVVNHALDPGGPRTCALMIPWSASLAHGTMRRTLHHNRSPARRCYYLYMGVMAPS